MPAFLTALVGGGFVAAAPLVTHHFDGSADEFSQRTLPVLPLLGWVACAVLGAIVLTHRVHLAISVDEGSTVAIAYDLLPLALFVTPVIAIWSLASGHLLLAAAAAILAGYHLTLIVPRLTHDRIPEWAHSAPRLTLVFANVYVDNATPEAAAAQLVGTGADVIVIAESTPKFFGHFDDAGGDVSHPYRLFDPDDTSDYAVAIASARPLGKRSVMHTVGPLSLAVAEVEVGGATVSIAALNPMTAFDPDGHATWKEQIEALKEFIPTIEGPLVIVGDLNATSYRPEFKELLDLGLTDGIDSLGQAWRPSFTLQSVWPLGALGAIARIDHALLNDQVCSMHVKNLPAKGSDHRPFEIILAIRSDDA
ncbi:MAG: Endonuclease/exonuclease/phosphatase [Ilumatobacteraceae bacterium]|nr:Endonuclease/exonuclease/phosphatase [Ilumatobacteraceae bacterium]